MYPTRITINKGVIAKMGYNQPKGDGKNEVVDQISRNADK